jgi:peptidoglycan biosynthesis protein MviN/MurJ (putative lipid II flippase)
LRAHIVRVIFGSGAFDWTDTRLTAAAFALLIISLTAHALTLLLVRGYYAAGRSYTPLFVQTFFAIGTVIAAVLLVMSLRDGSPLWFFESFLRVENVPGTIVLALPLAYSIGAVLSAGVLAGLFEMHFGNFLRGILRPLGEAIAAAGIGGTVAYGLLAVMGGISEATTFSLVLFHATIAAVGGLAAIMLTFAFLGSKELAETYQALHRRVWSVRPVSSSEEEV